MTDPANHPDILSRIFNYPFMDGLHSYADPAGNIRLYHYLKARRCINFLRQNASQEKVFLDAGAGRGQYCVAAKDIYKNVYCFEYDMKELAEAQKYLAASKNVTFKQADLTQIPLADKSVDIVVCSEVLEHIPRNDIAIEELYRVLKDDGKALISMPNRFSLFYQKVWMKNRKDWYPKPAAGTADPHFEQRRHLEYPFWKIKRLARPAGFKIAKRSGANCIPLPDRIRKTLMNKYPALFKLYIRTEKVLSSALPFCCSFYFITLTKPQKILKS